MLNYKFDVNKDNEDKRLDYFVSCKIIDKSRSYIQKLIKNGNIKVNGNIEKSKYKLKVDDEIIVSIPRTVEVNVKPQNIPISVLYEDDDVIVVNKPQGMVVHPAPGVYSGTLVNALLYHCKSLSTINGKTRPGIVHRIDKNTSGILVVAKNDYSHIKLAQQLKDHSMTREYIAIVEGILKDDSGSIDAPIGRHPKERIKMAVVDDGRNAVTHYKVIKRFKNNTLIKCILETGRTHQIRVHMSYIGHPLVGDPEYGYKKQKYKLQGQLLHAYKLGFIHPLTNEYLEFTTPVPDYFKCIIQKMNNIV